MLRTLTLGIRSTWRSCACSGRNAQSTTHLHSAISCSVGDLASHHRTHKTGVEANHLQYTAIAQDETLSKTLETKLKMRLRSDDQNPGRIDRCAFRLVAKERDDVTWLRYSIRGFRVYYPGRWGYRMVKQQTGGLSSEWWTKWTECTLETT